MPRSETPSLFPELQPAPLARDEMNFAEFPMAVLSARAPKGCTELVFSDEYTHLGKPIKRKLTVTAAPKYGLPTTKDEGVLLGLLALTKRQNNFSDRAIRFSRYELIQLLGMNDEGHTYQRIIDSLDVWANVYLKYENAWWDNDRKEHVTVGFHVVESWIAGSAGAGRRGNRIEVKWNEVAFRSFQANYVKQLDLAFYQSLDSAVSKRLYRFLDKNLYRVNRRDFDLGDLAYAHVGLASSSPLWKAKQAIEAATRELEERGYLEPLPASERFTKQARAKWRVLFVKKEKASEEPKVLPKASDAPPAKVSPLVAELVTRGVFEESARKLVAEHSAEVVSERIEAFDWKMGQKKKPESPSGYLFTSIDKELPLPEGFTPRAVLQARAEEKKRQLDESARKRQQEVEAKRVEEQQEADRRKLVDGFLKPLTDAKRKEFERHALAAGPADLVEAYRKAAGLNLATFAERQKYILFAHVIQAAEALPQSA